MNEKGIWLQNQKPPSGGWKHNYRKSPLFLRNGYESAGEWGIPIIKHQKIDTTRRIELIAMSDTSLRDVRNTHKGVHHFVDDPRFNVLTYNPAKAVEKYKRYRFVLTPDNSLFPEMELWRQLMSVGMSRWCGACWQENGLCVIPTVGWGLYPTFKFCFLGIERGGSVAISTLGCRLGKRNFMRGYDAMLEQISPGLIICFGKPFPEMRGNVTPVDYLHSRKAVR